MRGDGTSVLYIQYCYSSTNRLQLRTDIAIPHSFWNKKRECVSRSLPAEFGDAEIHNANLLRMRKGIEALIEQAKALREANVGQYVKDRFTPTILPETLANPSFLALTGKKEADFFTEIENYIKSKEKKVCTKSLGSFRGMRDHLLAFQAHIKKDITFSMLDYNFYTDFVEYLIYDYPLKRKLDTEYGLKTSTIGRTIKKLRMFIKDRVRRKIIPAIDLSDFKILDEQSDAVYLTYDEIGKVYTTDLSDAPYLIQYRDLFVLGALTALRFSDFTTLKYEDMRGELLYKKNGKTDIWTVIPMRQEAQEVFEKHFRNGIPKISNPKFNEYIKVICTRAGLTQPITFSYKKGNKDIVVTKPKAEWVTTHTCRRSFATNEYLAGTEVSLIMRITGHRTFKEFFKYIRISPEHAARQIQDVWKARNNMQTFTLSKTG